MAKSLMMKLEPPARSAYTHYTSCSASRTLEKGSSRLSHLIPTVLYVRRLPRRAEKRRRLPLLYFKVVSHSAPVPLGLFSLGGGRLSVDGVCKPACSSSTWSSRSTSHTDETASRLATGFTCSGEFRSSLLTSRRELELLGPMLGAAALGAGILIVTAGLLAALVSQLRGRRMWGVVRAQSVVAMTDPSQGIQIASPTLLHM